MKYTNQDGDLLVGKVVLHSVIGLFALITVLSSFGTIPAGYYGIRTQFNAVQGSVDSGLYFKIPFIQKVTRMSVQTQVVSFENSNVLAAASKDLQTVSLAVVLNYKIIDSKVTDIYSRYKTESLHQIAVIEPILRDAMKATSAKYTAEELITKRAEFVEEAEKTLIGQLQEKADLVVFERVNVVDIDFSKSFNEAIEAKVTAEQNALAAKNKLEQVKYEAEQRISQAKGEAEAIKIQAQAINSQGGADYVQLQAIKQWNGSVPTYMMGNAVPFINLNK